jgi:hypothetical protein
MIIIKTKQGDIFVNEKEMTSIAHNRELHTAEINDGKATGTLYHKPPIERVENIVYINEQTATEWKDNGSELEFLRKKIDALVLEMRCHKEICNGAKDHLLQLARDCVRWEYNYHNDMPDELAELMRKRGEEEKAYFDEIAGWEYPEKWMKNHQNAEKIEADEVARLNTIIEDQAAEIRELKAEIKRLENNEADHICRYHLTLSSATDPGDEPAPPRRPWWRRWLNF